MSLRHEFTRRSVLTAFLAALAVPKLVKMCECGHPRHEGLCPWCPAQRGCWAVSYRPHTARTIANRRKLVMQDKETGIRMRFPTDPVFLTKKGITVWR